MNTLYDLIESGEVEINHPYSIVDYDTEKDRWIVVACRYDGENIVVLDVDSADSQSVAASKGRQMMREARWEMPPPAAEAGDD